MRCDKVHHGAFALVDFTNATLNLDGSKECVNTTGMIEMYDKKPIHECTHKNEEQCHHTYVTQFEPIQEEECDVHYQKSCQVSYQILFFCALLSIVDIFQTMNHNRKLIMKLDTFILFRIRGNRNSNILRNSVITLEIIVDYGRNQSEKANQTNQHLD